MPAVASARTADSRPAPGPLTRTSAERSPYSFTLLAAVREACCAANGVPLRDPRKPSEPELDQASTLPTRSVNVMMVLLKDAGRHHLLLLLFEGFLFGCFSGSFCHG